MRYGYNGRQGGIDMRSVVLDTNQLIKNKMILCQSGEEVIQ